MILNSYIIDNCKNEDVNITEYIISNTIQGSGEYSSNDSSKLLTQTTESECLNEYNTCISSITKELIKQFSYSCNLINDKIEESDIVEKLKKNLNCDSESCILTNPRFTTFVTETIGSKDIINKELIINFKTKGPRDNTNLLSNTNIDETLIRWGKKFTNFFPCPFSMIDFNIILNKFGTINLKDIMTNKLSYTDLLSVSHNGPFNTFGCVLNTDTSNGPGKHWVCIFVDCRSDLLWTIEYFNSSGNPPCNDVVEWMECQRKNLSEIHDINYIKTITVTNIVHQKSNTECGMYVLYYIRSRLDDIPYHYFLTNRIVDNDVTQFRKHIFRKN